MGKAQGIVDTWNDDNGNSCSSRIDQMVSPIMNRVKPQSHSTFQSHRPSRHLLHAGLHAPNPFPALLGGEPTSRSAVFVHSRGGYCPSVSSRAFICVSKGAIAPRGTCCVASPPVRLINSVPCMAGGTTHHAGRHPRPFHALPPASGRSASRENAKKQQQNALRSLEQRDSSSHLGRRSEIGASPKTGPKKAIFVKKVPKPPGTNTGLLENCR